MRIFRLVWLFALSGLLFPAWSSAGGDFDLGLGYSKLKLDGRDQNLDEAHGFGGDLRLSMGLFPHVLEPLRFNLGLGFRYYNENGDGLSVNHPAESKLLLGTAEIGASWRQYLGPVFIEPGIGFIGIAGGYDASGSNVPDANFTDGGTGWGVRPSLKAGVALTIVELGAEVSYMWGDITFERGVGGDLEEFYAGAFIGLTW